MALTDFQRAICRLVAEQRKEFGVSYVAGGVALNLLLDSERVSGAVGGRVPLIRSADLVLAGSYTLGQRSVGSLDGGASMFAKMGVDHADGGVAVRDERRV